MRSSSGYSGHGWPTSERTGCSKVIAAPNGIYAVFKVNLDEKKTYPLRKRVIAFDSDGCALIVSEADRDSRRLMRADSFHNFIGLVDDLEAADLGFVAVIPAGGWLVERTFEDGSIGTSPLVGWGLRPDGSVIALDTDIMGVVEPLDTTLTKPDFRIVHPDQIQTKPGPEHSS